MKTCKFENASRDDVRKIAEIEKKYFGNYERAFDYDFLIKWFEHNDKMYFVTKDESEDVKAFVILVPVKDILYDKLLRGEVSDFFEFSPDEVCSSNESDYYYLADICLENIGKNISAIISLLKGTAQFLYDNAKYVTTSPITPYGLKMTEHLGFHKVSEQEFNGEIYPVYELKIPEKDANLPLLYEKLVKKGKR